MERGSNQRAIVVGKLLVDLSHSTIDILKGRFIPKTKKPPTISLSGISSGVKHLPHARNGQSQCTLFSALKDEKGEGSYINVPANTLKTHSSTPQRFTEHISTIQCHTQP